MCECVEKCHLLKLDWFLSGSRESLEIGQFIVLLL